MKYFMEKSPEVLKSLDVNESEGLSDSQVKERLAKYGYNEFSKKEEVSIWEDIKDAITEPMMIILLVAAVISGVIGEIYDSIGIVAAVAIGISIGIFTEGKSKKAGEALAKMTENIAVKVLRNKQIVEVNKNELVPGDIVVVETGDMIPADGRLIESIDLKLREDILTGEADDVSKKADVILELEQIKVKGEIKEQDPIPAKQINMVFGGTLVAYGRGKFVITATADASEMGKIAQNLEKSDLETPLQIKLGDLGTKISKISSVIALGLFVVIFAKMIMAKTLHVDTSGIIPFLDSIDPIKKAFVICVALIVAAVPEGLPTMINITLAITMQKMAKINALVTKKEACETIGSVSVICSDKTGTLTQNRMSVESVYINGDYVTEPEIEHTSYFVENCLVNSTANLEFEDDNVKYLGSATECALLLHHRDHDYMESRKKIEIVHQIPFNSKNKKMITIMNCDGDSCAVLSKGAPEVILNECTYENVKDKTVKLTEERKNDILKEIEKLQKKSMRVLGFAYKTIDDDEVAMASESEDMGEEFVFTGFVGIRDPLRTDVKESVEIAEKAGVTTKMLTGDNINTAIAIGEDLGILKNGNRAVEASYIDTLSEDELREEIKSIAIVARSKPDTKMRIVEALQANGEVVAVTGDGINDAPALTKADVGIAMGIAGTEVSKNAADIILTDDSFSTIVQGIKWGRGIYENFQRFVQFQITVNMVAFLIAILSVVFNFDMPFTTIQLLWVNIIMDGPPALSLGLESVRKAVLDRKPVNRNASIITKSMITTMILNALYISGIIIVQMTLNPLGASTEKVGRASEMETVLFALFAFSALFNAFNCREFGFDSIIPNFTKNKIALQIIGATAVVQILITEAFSGFFNAVPLSIVMWVKVIVLAFLVIVVNEVVKAVLRVLKGSSKQQVTE